MVQLLAAAQLLSCKLLYQLYLLRKERQVFGAVYRSQHVSSFYICGAKARRITGAHGKAAPPPPLPATALGKVQAEGARQRQAAAKLDRARRVRVEVSFFVCLMFSAAAPRPRRPRRRQVTCRKPPAAAAAAFKSHVGIQGAGDLKTDQIRSDQNLKSTLTPARFMRRTDPRLPSLSHGSATSRANSVLCVVCTDCVSCKSWDEG